MNEAKLVLSELMLWVSYLIFPALRSEEMASPPVLRSLRFGNKSYKSKLYILTELLQNRIVDEIIYVFIF